MHIEERFDHLIKDGKYKEANNLLNIVRHTYSQNPHPFDGCEEVDTTCRSFSPMV